MDRAFFTSRHFLVGALLATLLLAGAGAAYHFGTTNAIHIADHRACEAPAARGSALDAPPSVTTEENGERRTLTYTLDASAYATGALQLCVAVGQILVEPAAGSTAELTFVIRSPSPRAVEATAVEARFANDGGALRIDAWQSRMGNEGTWFQSEGAAVDLILRLPATGAYAVDAQADVGDVRIQGLRVDALSLATDVGNVHAIDVDAQRDVTATVDVGGILLRFASVQSGNVTARTDVGDMEIHLPQRADIGYDVEASTDVGEVDVRIGATDTRETHSDGPGETQRARTVGYTDKPTQVRVVATADVGDAIVTAA